MVFPQQQRWTHPLRTKSASFAPVGASGGSFTVSQSLLKFMNLYKLWETVKDRGVWCAAVHGVTELDVI